jgi:predicted DsbA family dithiol-disulfide isomerase
VQEQRLIIFADYVCPFCRLAETAAARLRAEGRVAVDGAAFELYPTGTPVPDVNAPWLRAAWTHSIEGLAAELGVPMKRPAAIPRTRKAHEAAAYAGSEGKQADMRAAIYAAYWQDGRDIGRIDVLVDIGRESGLDATRLKVALDIDQWMDVVEQDETSAARLGLSGVPAYVLTGVSDTGTAVAADMRVGVQRYEELRAWVEQDDV